MRNTALLAMASSIVAAPRAVCGTVSASMIGQKPAGVGRAMAMAHDDREYAKFVDTMEKICGSIQEFKAGALTRIDNLESAFNATAMQKAAVSLGIGERGLPVDREYSGIFASYMRNGGSEDELRKANADGYRAQIQAAMSVGTNSDGGYIAPIEWDRQVRKAEQVVNPIRRLATVITTSVGEFSTVWNNGAWGSGWVGETASRPATSTATLSTLTFPGGEIYANPSVTQRLLDDAQIDMEAWLADEIAAEFTKQESIAFISGNGVNKPFGLLTYVTGGAADGRHPGGNLTVINSGHASTIPNTDVLVDFAYSLSSPYRSGATWLMNSTTASTISKYKDGQGNYIWREGLMTGQPATLLGYPVEIDEGMPAIGAGNLPIAFGNFSRGYLINDRLGIRTLRDPFTNKPYVSFYTTKRVGAGVLDPFAIRLLKISA